MTRVIEPRPSTQICGLRSNAEFHPCKPLMWPRFFVSNYRIYGQSVAFWSIHLDSPSFLNSHWGTSPSGGGQLTPTQLTLWKLVPAINQVCCCSDATPYARQLIKLVPVCYNMHTIVYKIVTGRHSKNLLDERTAHVYIHHDRYISHTTLYRCGCLRLAPINATLYTNVCRFTLNNQSINQSTS